MSSFGLLTHLAVLPSQYKKEIRQLRVPGWAWTEVSEPRVVPLATNALYYLFLVVSE
jgi:hypothetical protein